MTELTVFSFKTVNLEWYNKRSFEDKATALERKAAWKTGLDPLVPGV